MKINTKKILINLVTILSLAYTAENIYTYILSPYINNYGAKIIDNRMQITNQKDDIYQSSVLINEKGIKEHYGTAYVVSKNSIVTNRHVVMTSYNSPEKIMVRVGHKDENGNSKFEDFDVVEVKLPEDERLDVAIVEVAKKNNKSISDYAKIVKFGSIENIKINDIANVVGYPGDKDYGTLWHSYGAIDMIEGSFISFLAVTKPGNSGSPIFNDKGEVIGMNNAGDVNKSFGFLIDKDIKKFIDENKR